MRQTDMRFRLLIPVLFAIVPLQALAATDSIVLGMGCFWGAEKRMSEIPGVLDVESGYAGGDAERTSYREVLNLEKRIQRGDR